jgi:hypothetical protein
MAIAKTTAAAVTAFASNRLVRVPPLRSAFERISKPFPHMYPSSFAELSRY